jgi:hypothetical protein
VRRNDGLLAMKLGVEIGAGWIKIGRDFDGEKLA